MTAQLLDTLYKEQEKFPVLYLPKTALSYDFQKVKVRGLGTEIKMIARQRH